MSEQAQKASILSPGQMAELVWQGLDEKTRKDIVSRAKLNLALKRDFCGGGR